MRAPRLAWEVKQWHPGITTYRPAGEPVRVSLNGGPSPAWVTTDYLLSHAAAAQWAVDCLGESLDAFARALRPIDRGVEYWRQNGVAAL